MQLIPNWRVVLRRAWSVRLIALAALLSGLEIVFAVFTDDPPIDRATFAVIGGLVTAAALIARFIAQETPE